MPLQNTQKDSQRYYTVFRKTPAPKRVRYIK